MEPNLTPPQPPQKRRSRFRAAMGLAAAATLIVVGYAYWAFYWPNGQHEPYDFAGIAKPIFSAGTMLSKPAVGSKESLKLPFEAIKEIIDPSIVYEDQSQSVIITTQDKVVRLKTSQLTALVNEKPFNLRFPVEKQGETVYVPIEPLKDLYGFDIVESEETGAVFLRKAGTVVSWGKIVEDPKEQPKSRALRSAPGIKSTIYADVKPGDKVMIWGEQNDWYRIQLQNGYIGFMRKSDVILDQPEIIPAPAQKPSFIPWKPLGGKINLTWQQVYNKNPDMSKADPMPGLNVISPQWFQLADGDGNLKQMGDPAFVKWARSQNIQVWALFSNGFEQKRTTESLATYDKRIKIIKQLISFAQMYGIQGINIDFENVNLKDKANLVQFVREMTPLLHEQGLVVSIDVTVKDGSDNYSLFMDRKAIGEVVDYMMVMTYDEHWASSQKAGSVASLPWVEKGITQIMKEDAVPPSKLLLGVPYYTRIWTEQTKDGKTSVTSKAVSMDAVQKLIKEKNLTPVFDQDTGQNYVQYTEDNNTVKIWIEDEVSMRSRIELVKKYDLAGVASWSRGFEKPEIWTLIKDMLDKKP